MSLDCFREILDIVYIAKKLHETNKYELVTNSFFDTLDYEEYYENMYSLFANLFEYYNCWYYEYKNVELHIFSDPVIVDFFILAGKYGKQHNISDENNTYIQAAISVTHENLNFSYCLDWMLMGHIEPKRQYHSRLGVFISQDDCVDLACLAYGLIEIHEWFANMCVELSNLLDDD